MNPVRPTIVGNMLLLECLHPTRQTAPSPSLLYPKVGNFAATGCTTGEPLGHLGNPVREFTIDPKDKSKISLKILHFPLPVG